MYIYLAFSYSTNVMKKILTILEAINEKAGILFSWSTLLMVILICTEVVMRYVFNRSFIWMVELEIYLFAFSFLLAAGYAFKHDKHVRVDLFYARFSEKKKAMVNILGGLFFLIPWCLISIIGCLRYANISWRIGEVSQQAGGLPMVYLLKYSLALGFTLLLIQALASILRSILIIQGKEFNS